MKPKIKYINGDVNHGIAYDWNKIRKEYAKLKCPDLYYNPCTAPLEEYKYFVEYSMRSVGKTTGWLLLGMVMHEMYGTVIQYLRQTEDQIAPKTTKDLFNAILANGYVQKITKNKYNSIYYNARRWYYCNVDEAGKVVEVAPEHFMNGLVVTRSYDYKSGYNAPAGDLIIYDEFVTPYYYPNEFVYYCDLVKTIIRDRLSPICVMLSNNIDKEASYYSEMEIYDEIQHLQPKEHTGKTTSQGTRIYIEYIYAPEEKIKHLKDQNSNYFGFKNKQLGSITGEDWSIKPRQHIPPFARPDTPDIEYIMRNIFVYHHERYLRLDIVLHEKLGLCCYVHRATKTRENSVILTLENRFDNRYHYGLGPRKLERMLQKLRQENRFYYESNDVATFLDAYINEWAKTRF